MQERKQDTRLNQLIIRLSGDLDAVMGSDLYLKLKEITIEPHKILLDCSGLTSLDEVGAEFLRKSIRLAEDRKTRLAMAAFPGNLSSGWQKFGLSGLIPKFSSNAEAQSFLSQNLEVSPSLHDNHTWPPSQGKFDTDQQLCNCPGCKRLLRVFAVGDYQCPECGTKFYLNKIGRISTYEKLV